MRMGSKILELMHAQQINANELSDLSGVGRATLSRFLNTRSDIGTTKLVNLLYSLDVDLDQMIEDRKNSLDKNKTRHTVNSDVLEVFWNLSKVTRRGVLLTLVRDRKKGRGLKMKQAVLRLNSYVKGELC